MAAKSKNKYDVFNWIKDKVIPSCTMYVHINATDKLIWQFEKQYSDWALTRELTIILNHQNINYETI